LRLGKPAAQLLGTVIAGTNERLDTFFAELSDGLPDAAQISRVVIRLAAAALLGAVIGIQRERAGKPAGLRTHMLVSLGAALFVIAALEAGLSAEDASRVIQGIATGIGFIGGGAILKLHDEREITGLTTAAGIWMTAAVGVAAGLGRWGSAAAGVALTWIVLAVLVELETRIEKRRAARRRDGEPSGIA
jgi:putative Mg2+ transporter-C (MgtC) family protein